MTRRRAVRAVATPPAAGDEAMMRRCLALARRAEGRTAPNPIVGCVIVDRRGRVLAEGHHRGPGTPHAEAAALAALGGRAPGATLYVSLEPCNHRDGGRAACAPAVRASGVARVVIGAMDPVPGHGGGARLLARAGVAVTRGVLGAACEDANAGFFTWARRGRPRFVLKAAVTLDGKLATVGGASRWITGELARADGRRVRERTGAILVGVGTVLADDPRLTARTPRGRDPVRIVVDSRLRTPPGARLLPATSGSRVRTIIATTAAAPAARARRLEAAGAEVWRLPAGRTRGGRGKAASRAGRVDLAALAARLGAAGLTQVLVEGGAEIHAAMLAAGLADEVRLYVAPLVVGGPAPSWVGGAGVAALADAWRFELAAAPRRIGPDLMLRLRPRSGRK